MSEYDSLQDSGSDQSETECLEEFLEGSDLPDKYHSSS